MSVTVRKKDQGRYALVRFDDVGVETGIVVQSYKDDEWITVFMLNSRDTEKVSRDQIVKVGEFVKVPVDALGF